MPAAKKPVNVLVLVTPLNVGCFGPGFKNPRISARFSIQSGRSPKKIANPSRQPVQPAS